MSALTPEEREALEWAQKMLISQSYRKPAETLQSLRDRLDKAEPVAWHVTFPDEPELQGYFATGPVERCSSAPLYTAPPAPAAPRVPVERSWNDAPRDLDATMPPETAWALGFNACRAEILRLAAAPRNEQGGE